MGRALGVDVGQRRTGLAISDPLRVTCTPLSVVAENRPDLLVKTIARTAMEEHAELIVVGVPRPLRCDRNAQVDRILSIVGRLRTATRLPVITWDERFTTKLAESLPARNGEIDAVAAAYMLQGYLDSCRAEDE